MPTFLVLQSAKYRLEEIYRYTKTTWGQKQAEEYINGLFNTFQKVTDKALLWHPIPAEFGVSGYFTTYKRHYIYWKELSTGQVGIVTVLHERMHQLDRFQEDTALDSRLPTT